MTNNQLTYWANIERERANRAAEAIDRARVAAQRYSARLSYAAAKLQSATQKELAQWKNQWERDFYTMDKLGYLGGWKWNVLDAANSAYNKAGQAFKSALNQLGSAISEYNKKFDEFNGMGNILGVSTNIPYLMSKGNDSGNLAYRRWLTWNVDWDKAFPNMNITLPR